MKITWRWYDFIFIVLFFYFFVLQIQAIWPFTIDDAYISLRYAKHWAEGNGLLWNLHDPPVEGYSNFSFVVLAVLTLLFNGDPILALKIAGLLGLFFTCYFIYLISRFWFAPRESLAPTLGVLIYKGQIIWATSGLETAFYEALICASVYCCFRGMGYRLAPKYRGDSVNRFFLFAGLLLSTAGMTRPEAPVLMLLFFILVCWDRPSEKNLKYRQGVAFLFGTLIVCYLPYFIWRITYYGYLFPNSVYCKQHVANWSLDSNYIKLVWPFFLLAVPACFKAKDRRHYFLWLPSVVYLIGLINADPVVAFANRLFLPAFVLFLPLAMQGISILLSLFCPHQVFKLLFYLCALLVAVLFIPAMSLADYRYFTLNPLAGEQLRLKVVNWLHTHALANANVVLADSGMVPYFSKLNFIDSYCLNNLTMAHYPASSRYNLFCKEVLGKKPEIIILTSLIQEGKVIYSPSDVCLKSKLNHLKNFKLKDTFLSSSPDSNSAYRYEIYQQLS